MSGTDKRLFHIRQILRQGIEVNIQHLTNNRIGINSYKYKNRDEYNEWINYKIKYDDGTFISGNEEIMESSRKILKLIRDNHDIKIEDIWGEVKKLSNENEYNINIEWNIVKNLPKLVNGTVFGNFTKLEQEHLTQMIIKNNEDYDNKLEIIKQRVFNNREKRKMGKYWDEDIDINNNINYIDDLIRPKYASDYLISGEYPPDDIKIDSKALETAVKSSKLELVKWICERMNYSSPLTEKALSVASNLGFIDIVKYLIEEQKSAVNAKILRESVYSGNRQLVDYLLTKNSDTTRILEVFQPYYYKYKDDTHKKQIWELVKYVDSLHSIHMNDTILRDLMRDTDIFNWLLKKGANRYYAVHNSVLEANTDQLLVLLDTNSTNYENSNKRDKLLIIAFNALMNGTDTLNNDSAINIYGELIKRGLFDKNPINNLISKIYNIKQIELFECAKDILSVDKWKQLLTPDLLYSLYEKVPLDRFNELIMINLNKTIKLVVSYEGGVDLLVNYFEKQYGPTWMDLIDKDQHNLIFFNSSPPIQAANRGFKLYRSIYQSIGYREAKNLFKYAKYHQIPIIDDTLDDWIKQQEIFKTHNFTNNNIQFDQLKTNCKYRILVFDLNEFKDIDGYWKSDCIYDITESHIIKYKTENHVIMSGINNGLLVNRNHNKGEDQRKDFHLINDDDDIIMFYPSEHDGGSLNCRGEYYVRIIPN